MKRIKQFIFNNARYNVRGVQDDVILEIDYLNNRYKLKNKRNILSKDFEREVQAIAQDLLRRKHAVNFANSLKIRS